MICSMTGFGEARQEGDAFSLLVELRSVNNRHLKVTVRGPDPYPMLEAEVEKLLRQVVKRGTVTVQVRVQKAEAVGECRINEAVLVAYVRQIDRALKISQTDSRHWPAVFQGVLGLPGVADSSLPTGHPSEEEWAIFEKVLSDATDNLQKMRLEEGRAMAAELSRQREALIGHLDAVRTQAPRVSQLFRARVADRVSSVLKDHNVTLGDEHIVREVALFSDRCDISEETARLDSHLGQLKDIIENEKDSPGRKLEFLTQEMSREANTIGSKSNDTAISRLVVEMKATLEKIREQVQNIE